MSAQTAVMAGREPSGDDVAAHRGPGSHKDLRHGRRQVPALRGVTLDVAAGEFVAVTGPSGSGKSTFMHILGCLDRPTSGQYLLDGQDVSRLSNATSSPPCATRRSGSCSRGSICCRARSALENVELPLLYRRPAPKSAARHAAALAALEAVGLGDARGSPSESALGRAAAARRDRARADQQPVDPARRRADRQPRHAHQHRGDGDLPAAEPRARHHHRARHARARHRRVRARTHRVPRRTRRCAISRSRSAARRRAASSRRCLPPTRRYDMSI